MKRVVVLHARPTWARLRRLISQMLAKGRERGRTKRAIKSFDCAPIRPMGEVDAAAPRCHLMAGLGWFSIGSRLLFCAPWSSETDPWNKPVVWPVGGLSAAVPSGRIRLSLPIRLSLGASRNCCNGIVVQRGLLARKKGISLLMAQTPCRTLCQSYVTMQRISLIGADTKRAVRTHAHPNNRLRSYCFDNKHLTNADILASVKLHGRPAGRMLRSPDADGSANGTFRSI